MRTCCLLVLCAAAWLITTTAANASPLGLDTTFGTGGYSILDPNAQQVAQMPGGQVAVATVTGDFGAGAYDLGVKLLQPDGTALASWGTQGNATLATNPPFWPTAMTATGDGGVGVVGESGQEGTDAAGNPATIEVARLTSSGQPDEAFGTHGLATFGHVAANSDSSPVVAACPNGDLLFESAGNLIAADANGALDPNFGHGGKVAFHAVIETIDCNAQGGIVVGLSGNTLRLVGLQSNGSVDQSWGIDGVAHLGTGPTTDILHSVSVTPDGSYLVSWGQDFMIATDHLAKFDQHGALDPTFGHAGAELLSDLGLPREVTNIVPLSDGRILLQGSVEVSTDDPDAKGEPFDGSLTEWLEVLKANGSIDATTGYTLLDPAEYGLLGDGQMVWLGSRLLAFFNDDGSSDTWGAYAISIKSLTVPDSATPARPRITGYRAPGSSYPTLFWTASRGSRTGIAYYALRSRLQGTHRWTTPGPSLALPYGDYWGTSAIVVAGTNPARGKTCFEVQARSGVGRRSAWSLPRCFHVRGD